MIPVLLPTQPFVAHKPVAAPATVPHRPDVCDSLRVTAPLQVQMPNPFLPPILPHTPTRPAGERVVVGATGSDATKG